MWRYNYSNSYDLYHYGILGMKWGVHRAQKKQAVKSMASNKGHKYAGVLDAANSAARSYYKKQNIDRKSDKTNNLKSNSSGVIPFSIVYSRIDIPSFLLKIISRRKEYINQPIRKYIINHINF